MSKSKSISLFHIHKIIFVKFKKKKTTTNQNFNLFQFLQKLFCFQKVSAQTNNFNFEANSRNYEFFSILFFRFCCFQCESEQWGFACNTNNKKCKNISEKWWKKVYYLLVLNSISQSMKNLIWKDLKIERLNLYRLTNMNISKLSMKLFVTLMI